MVSLFTPVLNLEVKPPLVVTGGGLKSSCLARKLLNVEERSSRKTELMHFLNKLGMPKMVINFQN